MGSLKLFVRMPQPVKTTVWLSVVALVITVVTVFRVDGAPDTALTQVLAALFPAVYSVTGLLLALNIRGNSDTVADLTRTYGSRRWTTPQLRLLGLGIFLLGVVLAVFFAVGVR